MRFLPTGKWMGMADTHTIQEIGIPSLVLMERAALSCLEALKREGMNLEHTLIVCGSGNNGGDGLVLARLLHEEGRQVTVVFAGRMASRSGECKKQMEILERLGIGIHTEIPKEAYSLVVDAVFGVGLGRPIEGTYRQLILEMNGIAADKMAVDIPSGIDSANGKVLGCAFRADLTVSMQCEKLGTVLYPGCDYAGKVVAVPIGIDLSFFENRPEICHTYERKDIAKRLPARRADSHKGSYGRVLVIAGSKGMSGAAYLCASAAYAVGAGLVRIYTPEENRIVLQQLLPEAILTTYQDFRESEIEELLTWADVAAIGPGIGQSETSARILEAVLKRIRKPCVIDADGLNLLSGRDAEGKERKDLLLRLQGQAVLTPHMKEMERLLKDSGVEELKENRFSLLQDFTKRYPVVCALKDARTAVAEQGKSIYVNTSGNDAMAKGGSGDVLTGTIAGLMAQKMEGYDAARLGVYLHGTAGDLAAEEKGNYGVLAGDLIEKLQYCGKIQEDLK